MPFDSAWLSSLMLALLSGSFKILSKRTLAVLLMSFPNTNSRSIIFSTLVILLFFLFVLAQAFPYQA